MLYRPFEQRDGSVVLAEQAVAEVVRKLDAANREELVTKEFFRAELRAELRLLENRLIIWMIGLVTTLGGLMIATRIFA